MVPENMRGTTLYPLNQLRDVHPDAYNEEVKKYAERKLLMKRRIPHLDCLWNDVLHLTAIHPGKIKKAFKKIGKDLFRTNWFKIDPRELEASRTIVFLYQNRPREFQRRNDPDNYEAFQIKELPRYNSIPQATIDYYQEEIRQGKNPLLFHLVPRILYKSTIDTKKCEVIRI